MQKESTENWGKRDALVKMEKDAQKIWEDSKIYESEPDDDNPEKYFVTFPYPYMNGRMHLGHAYSMTKAEFTARFARITGHNTLFPFSFHCTGMPIMASADKLKRQFDQYEIDGDESFKCQGVHKILRMSEVDEEEIP